MNTINEQSELTLTVKHQNHFQNLNFKERFGSEMKNNLKKWVSSKIVTAAACALFGFASAAHGAIVTNGGFEDPNQGGAIYLSGVPAGLTDWTTTGSYPGINTGNAIIGTPAAEGTQYVWLQNLSGDNSTIFQTVTLPATGLYQLSFWVGARENATPSAAYEITLGATSLAGGDIGFSGTSLTHIVTNFSASAGSYTLTLLNVSPTAEDRTVGFDDVQITPLAVPEPNAFLLTALASAPLLRFRRARLRKVA